VLTLQRCVELGSLGRGEDRLDLRAELLAVGTARRLIDVPVRLARLRGEGGDLLPLGGAQVQRVNGVQEAAALVVVGGRRSAGRSGERGLLRAGRERGGEHGGERRERENAEMHHYGGDTYGGYLSS